MRIIVNGMVATIKAGSSFDFVAENRMFLGRDSYTLSIPFPLKDCPENIRIFGHLNRKDDNMNLTDLDCVISDGAFAVSGSLLVTSVSEAEVQCQFVDGRCETVTKSNKISETKITTLDLGYANIIRPELLSGPTEAWNPDRGYVALPWVNDDYPDSPNNWVDYNGVNYVWNSEVDSLSWQPYLLELVKRIFAAIDYTCDLSKWEQSPMKYLLVCNTLPATWNIRNFARILPDWTITEFFEKIELALGMEFDFDHRSKKCNFSFTQDTLDGVEPVKIDDVIESFSVSVSNESGASDCNYLSAKRLTYSDNNSPLWKYLSCDWLFDRNPKVPIVIYNTITELISHNKRKDSYDTDGNLVVTYGETVLVGDDAPFNPGLPAGYTTTHHCILYARDVDTYFVLKTIGLIKSKRIVPSNNLWGPHKTVETSWFEMALQPINIYGAGIPESDDIETEELDFVPAWIQSTYVSADDHRGQMIFLSPGELPDNNLYSDDGVVRQSGTAYRIEKGEPDDAPQSFYDVIYLGYWDGSNHDGARTHEGFMPCPFVDNIKIYDDWTYVISPQNVFRLDGSTGFNTQKSIPHVDPKVKYSFSWLGNTVPNARAIFNIQGKNYVCEKITATVTENGVSQLLKGEFYRIV